MGEQDIAGPLEVVLPAVAAGVVEADDKVRLRRSGQRFSIFSQGVKRSLREITAKSWVSGAPSTAAPPQAAVMPGTTSISMGGYARATS